jgi:soluble lytic murein transglycosylase-like protein
MIRMITDDQLFEGKVLRYAGLIFQAANKYRVNPLEIIAIIVAESEFKESSINAKTGDYGLGQINWRHWGKDYGLTPQDLLDPAINIYMTCHVYKFFGQDFGKYHRGNGVKSDAYMVNVKGILSTLHAFAELSGEDVS